MLFSQYYSRGRPLDVADQANRIGENQGQICGRQNIAVGMHEDDKDSDNGEERRRDPVETKGSPSFNYGGQMAGTCVSVETLSELLEASSLRPVRANDF